MTDFQLFQIDHYTTRLAEERAKGNDKAVSFLREQLHFLKQA